MARQEIVTCENPRCGKDITQGDGRMTRMNVMSEVVAQRPFSNPKHDAGKVYPQMHFCDIVCVAAWAGAEAASWVLAESDYQEKVLAANRPLSSEPSEH